jgi:hypothetical protein
MQGSCNAFHGHEALQGRLQRNIVAVQKIDAKGRESVA